MIKTVCFSGLRTQKLPWKADKNDLQCIKLKELLRERILYMILDNGISHFISGMARGVDTYAAEIVLELKKTYPITLECALPCMEQAGIWEEEDRIRYFSIIGWADHQTMIEKHYTIDCFEKRNRYMVMKSDIVLAVWDGQAGGTANTIHYAREAGKPILIIDPTTLREYKY